MQTVQFANTPARVSEMCLGTMMFGGRCDEAESDRVLGAALDRQPPPTRSGRSLKIFYGTQVRTDPPTFLIYVNDYKLVHFTYERFLENQIRELHGFLGTPIHLVFKNRE